MSERMGFTGLSMNQRKTLCAAKSDGKCALCGAHLNFNTNNINVEHFVPLFVAKWSLGTDEETRVIAKKLNKKVNMGITHGTCNYDKGVTIPDVSQLYLNKTAKEELQTYITEMQPYIDKAFQNMETVRQRQDCKCYVCGEPLTENYTLRRKDSKKPRSLDNAVCVHADECSKAIYGLRRKKILTVK